MRLLRQVLAVACVAIVLYQEPFMVKARKAKVVPLHLALGGALHWANASPRLQDNINVTSRWLLTPLEYVNTPTAKRTLGAAYGKTARKLDRLLDVNSTVQKTVQRPTPNVPLIGASMLTLGAGSAVVIPGAELAILGGCGCLLFGCPGMKSQPELFFVALLATAGLAALRSSRASDPKPKPKSKRKSKPAKPRAPCDDSQCGSGCGDGHCH